MGRPDVQSGAVDVDATFRCDSSLSELGSNEWNTKSSDSHFTMTF